MFPVFGFLWSDLSFGDKYEEIIAPMFTIISHHEISWWKGVISLSQIICNNLKVNMVNSYCILRGWHGRSSVIVQSVSLIYWPLRWEGGMRGVVPGTSTTDSSIEAYGENSQRQEPEAKSERSRQEPRGDT